MEVLNPRHEKVFQAKAMFLQEDENWVGALEVLKDCAATIPESVYCLRRLANIRSSTIEDKIRYGIECLQLSKTDLLCMVDVAMAFASKGEFAKAKVYFEQALNLPMENEGYEREMVLYQYGLTLENLRQDKKAKEAFLAACRLNMKSACDRVQPGES
ncbi:MAG: hypothetical protein NDI61_13130 [Bdellovibrionaceae bacterium]|nr:hypothetical protein [Pseudobdellovibrionaceae bacterium]